MSIKEHNNVKHEETGGFNSRWGLLLTLIGLSVGTGNIWRFPRMAALNGGGAFILAWTIMLVLVAIPVIIGEVVIGRATRHGVPGAFKDFIGKKYTWMGTFMTIVVTAIAAYYTVVMAWVLRYIIMSITQSYFGQDTLAIFNDVANGSVGTVICFIMSLALTGLVCIGGVGKSIEKVQKLIVPVLFVLLIVVAVRALTLPGAEKGLNFMFTIKKEYLFSSKTWLNALTQILWSVGAGWGLVMTYAVYTKAKSDIALNEFVQGFGNNVAALLGGVVVLPTLFAMSASPEIAQNIAASGNNGLTFISLAGIFADMPGGGIISIIFFIALYLAALSSNIGHFLLSATPFIDAGYSRKKATVIIFVICLAWGLPSAWSETFFSNQDWVAGMSLVIGTLFTCFALSKYGTERIRKNLINIPENDLYVGKWWSYCIKYITPAICIIMIAWWTIQSFSWYEGADIWNPLESASLGTWLAQATLYIVVAIFISKTINKETENVYFDGESYPPIPEEHK